MEHNPPPDIKEDYKFYAKLSWKDIHEFTVPCKIFLPQTVIESPQVYIYPKFEQFHTLSRMRTCHLSASIGDPPEIEIIGEQTHISGGSMHSWEPGLEEGYLKIYPAKLHLVRHLNTNRKERGETTLLFKLTPSLYLSPWDFREYHFEGEAKLTRGERFHFQLGGGFELEFLNHYKWIEPGNGKTLTYPELVAIAKLAHQPKEKDIQNYLSLIDDFLLLVSLAEGQRCVTPVFSLQLPNKIAETYRLDRSIPNISSKHSFNNSLISSSDFEKFMNRAWKSFKESDQYRLIKTALEIITNDIRGTMEAQFLSLYSSVETLILAFRLDKDLEFILKEASQRNYFTKDLKSFIKSHVIFQNNKEARSLVYQNIAGLHRLPLHHAFNQFVKAKNLDLSDLWPFYDDKVEWSLTKIRNRLLHGYSLDERFIDSFGNSLKNLRYYAKRLLLVSLNWDFRKSRLFRMTDSEIKKWQDAREVIKTWS